MKVYETIRPSDVLNDEGNPVSEIGVGVSLKGEPIEIDGQVYLESDQGFVLMENLAEKVDAEEVAEEATGITSKMSSSSKKLIMALGGAALGFGIASYRKMGTKKIAIFTVAGVAVALAADYFINKRSTK
jgi:hypothetical protein